MCTYIYHHHHHHIALVARISLTLSRHSSLSFIALGRSSGQQPVSSHSCWMYVRAGRPAFARPCVGIHKSTSLMSSSLLLQQCPACLVRLTWIVFVIGGRWPYSWCLVGCCCQDLLYIYIYIYTERERERERESEKEREGLDVPEYTFNSKDWSFLSPLNCIYLYSQYTFYCYTFFFFPSFFHPSTYLFFFPILLFHILHFIPFLL